MVHLKKAVLSEIQKLQEKRSLKELEKNLKNFITPSTMVIVGKKSGEICIRLKETEKQLHIKTTTNAKN